MAVLALHAPWIVLLMIGTCYGMMIYGEVDWQDLGPDLGPRTTRASTILEPHHDSYSIATPSAVNMNTGTTPSMIICPPAIGESRHEQWTSCPRTLSGVGISTTALLRNLSSPTFFGNRTRPVMTRPRTTEITTVSIQKAPQTSSGVPGLTTFAAPSSSGTSHPTPSIGRTGNIPSSSPSTQHTPAASSSAGSVWRGSGQAGMLSIVGLALLHSLVL
ncbi:hypothetical protein CBS147347_11195 [Aspergillus niger]|nr:hypothetical protein CBS147347_11195 [Aspergillus niger]